MSVKFSFTAPRRAAPVNADPPRPNRLTCAATVAGRGADASGARGPGPSAAQRAKTHGSGSAPQRVRNTVASSASLSLACGEKPQIASWETSSMFA